MAAIGIDLGTTNCCVAVVNNGKVEVLPNEVGNRTTPSVIAFHNDVIEVGEIAKNKASRYPADVIYGVKYMIGRKINDPFVQAHIKNWPFSVLPQDGKIIVTLSNGKSYTPEELSGIVLKELKRSAEKRLHETVETAVITVPTYFNDASRQATIDAGKIAGFKNVTLLNEPTAAAVAYGVENAITDGRTVLIFDFGGGTFDVSVLKFERNNYEVLAIDGDISMGGDDVDNNLMKFIATELAARKNVDILGNKRFMVRLKNAAESAKISLSTKSSVEIELFSFLGSSDSDDCDLILDREKFDEINKDIFDKSINVLISCLKKTKLKKENIDAILLVGGSTRIPNLRERIEQYFGQEAKKNINPDEAVAIGAAIVANKSLGENFQDLKLNQICAHSLGIELHNRNLSVLIPQFSEIPVTKYGEYFTHPVGSSKCRIHIYSGENKIAKQNEILGKFSVDGVSNGPKGRMVTVTFKIDENGILVVKAVDQRGKSEHLTIKLDKGNLTVTEIEESTDKLRKIFKISDDSKEKLSSD